MSTGDKRAAPEAMNDAADEKRQRVLDEAALYEKLAFIYAARIMPRFLRLCGRQWNRSGWEFMLRAGVAATFSEARARRCAITGTDDGGQIGYDGVFIVDCRSFLLVQVKCRAGRINCNVLGALFASQQLLWLKRGEYPKCILVSNTDVTALAARACAAFNIEIVVVPKEVLFRWAADDAAPAPALAIAPPAAGPVVAPASAAPAMALANVPLRPWQTKARDFFMERFEHSPRCVLAAVCGAGKSMLMVVCTSDLFRKPAVRIGVVASPTLALVEQSKRQFDDFLPSDIASVRFDSEGSLDLEAWQQELQGKRALLHTTYKSLSEATALVRALQEGGDAFLLADEAHVAGPYCDEDALASYRYALSVSGTPRGIPDFMWGDGDGDEDVFHFSHDEAIKAGYIVPSYLLFPRTEHFPLTFDEKLQLIALSCMRKYIRRLIIFCNRIDMARRIANAFQCAFQPFSIDASAHVICGETKPERRGRLLTWIQQGSDADIRALVSPHTLDTGTNAPRVSGVAFFDACNGTIADAQRGQRPNRAFARKTACYQIFCDNTPETAIFDPALWQEQPTIGERVQFVTNVLDVTEVEAEEVLQQEVRERIERRQQDVDVVSMNDSAFRDQVAALAEAMRQGRTNDRAFAFREIVLDVHNFATCQRHKKKNGRLSKERIAMLDAIGFLWDPYEDAFERKLVQYQRAVARYGYVTRSLVIEDPETGKEMKIGNWLRDMRNARFGNGMSAMDDARIARLDAIRFDWYGHSEFNWKINSVVQYLKEHGNVQVKDRCQSSQAMNRFGEEGWAMGFFVNTFRQKVKNGRAEEWEIDVVKRKGLTGLFNI